MHNGDFVFGQLLGKTQKKENDMGGLALVLWIALMVFMIGFFIRAEDFFYTVKKQNKEIIEVLKGIRDTQRK